MLAMLLVLVVFVRIVWNSARDPAMHGLFLAVAVLIVGGTAFYEAVEGWGVVNSLYFSVTTLTTVGYGDYAPTTDESKIFTIFYLMVGLGVITTFVTTVVQRAPLWQRHERKLAAMEADEHNTGH